MNKFDAIEERRKELKSYIKIDKEKSGLIILGKFFDPADSYEFNTLITYNLLELGLPIRKIHCEDE